jgi:beta-galactosidase
VLADLAERAGVSSELPANLRGRVELAIRGDYRFLINRTEQPADISGVPGRRLVGDATVLGPRAVAVLRA